ncbi:Zinc finger, PHD-finger [Dillenia turbinata]|uniref:Zinc finger, PHD-finger n=1 Tax=Dillenia turbinata TaxID=194707 RepID=A0AAN8WE22_9MAGN
MQTGACYVFFVFLIYLLQRFHKVARRESLEMLLKEEVEVLCDDGFDGSNKESEIFKEIFFGRDVCRNNKRCLVTGLINFEHDYKCTDVPHRVNSDSSAVTGQSSSKDLTVEDSTNAIEDSRDTSGSRYSREGCAAVGAKEQDIKAKRIKLSSDKFPNDKHSSVKCLTSSVPVTETGSAMSLPDDQTNFQIVTCRLVESSGQGVTSSCYLLRQRVEIDKEGHVADMDISLCKLPSSDGNDEKDLVTGKAIASPVSQDSVGNKLIIATPVTIADKSGLPLGSEDGQIGSLVPELNVANLSLKNEAENDLRQLLRCHIDRILLEAGWGIGRVQRLCRRYKESVYKSPGGKTIWEVTRAWKSCGASLCCDGIELVQENDSMHWNDVDQFRSDLSKTLLNIEKEMRKSETTIALACQWCLLDPFVAVVFVYRKIGALRKGHLVTAPRSLAVDMTCKVLKSVADRGSGSAEKNMALGLYNSSLAAESGLTVSEDNNYIHPNPFVDRSVLECGMQKKGGPVNSFGGISIHLMEPKAASRSGGVHYHSNNVLPGVSNSGSFHQDSNTGSPSSYEHSDGNLLQRDRRSGLLTFYQPELQNSEDNGAPLASSGVQECFVSHDKNNGNSSLSAYKHRGEINQLSSEKSYHNCGGFGKSSKFTCDVKVLESPDSEYGVAIATPIANNSKNSWKDAKSRKSGHQGRSGQKKSTSCQIDDDALLITTFIRGQKKTRKSKGQRNLKQKGRCRLLPRSLGKGGKNFVDGKAYFSGVRTVLSWLVVSGFVSLNEVIQYRNPKTDMVVKYGLVTRDGIRCKCCREVFSVSGFKVHAGFKFNRPCVNLYMEKRDTTFTYCQLEACAAEFKARKNVVRPVDDEETDQNDDTCGLCGDGGELICCDNCPSTYHLPCLSSQELPEGNWYCPNCTCRICGGVANEKEASSSYVGLKCSQCEHKYHEACLKVKGDDGGSVSDTWFCGGSCYEIHSGLQARIGSMNNIDDGFSWTLLRYIHGDQKTCSPQQIAQKAECNAKLAVALTIMEECFLPMVDPRTGINMIPHVLYNWGSDFARLNYSGFYTMVLERDDVLISAASIRIHGARVAEMPLVATCSKYRRQGMCRRLMNVIIEMLRSFKVEMLVVAAIASLVDTWTVGFGFEIMEDLDRQKLNDINLMVFPGTVWLKKPLCSEEESGPSTVASALVLDEATTTTTCEAEGNAESLKQSCGNSPSLGTEAEIAASSPNQTCDASSIGDTVVKTVSGVELVVYDERNLSLTKQLQKACTVSSD